MKPIAWKPCSLLKCYRLIDSEQTVVHPVHRQQWFTLLSFYFNTPSVRLLFDTMAFKCPDCEQEREGSMKYIVRFKSERKIGTAGRNRRSDVHEDGDRIRCLQCHGTLAKIYRTVNNEGWQDGFASVKGEHRAKLLRETHELLGTDLPKRISLAIEETNIFSQITTFNAGGGFMDEDDLNAKYKSKPEQLKNIKEFGQSFVCPVRKCKMWLDPKYVLKNETFETHERVEKRKAGAELTVKATKAKRESKPKEENPEKEMNVKPLKVTQIEKITAGLDKIKKSKKTFVAFKARMNQEVRERIPKFQIYKIDLQQAALDSCIAQVELTIEQSHGDFKHLVSEIAEVMKSSKVLGGTLANLIDEAEGHVAAKKGNA